MSEQVEDLDIRRTHDNEQWLVKHHISEIMDKETLLKNYQQIKSGLKDCEFQLSQVDIQVEQTYEYLSQQEAQIQKEREALPKLIEKRKEILTKDIEKLKMRLAKFGEYAEPLIPHDIPQVENKEIPLQDPINNNPM
jgi:hypothetical protein